jgi:hypothetical protein
VEPDLLECGDHALDQVPELVVHCRLDVVRADEGEARLAGQRLLGGIAELLEIVLRLTGWTILSVPIKSQVVAKR